MGPGSVATGKAVKVGPPVLRAPHRPGDPSRPAGLGPDRQRQRRQHLPRGRDRTPLLDGYLTLTSAEAARAAEALGRPKVLAVRTEGWAQFTEGRETVTAAFAAAGTESLLLPTDEECPVML